MSKINVKIGKNKIKDINKLCEAISNMYYSWLTEYKKSNITNYGKNNELFYVPETYWIKSPTLFFDGYLGSGKSYIIEQLINENGLKKIFDTKEIKSEIKFIQIDCLHYSSERNCSQSMAFYILNKIYSNTKKDKKIKKHNSLKIPNKWKKLFQQRIKEYQRTFSLQLNLALSSVNYSKGSQEIKCKSDKKILNSIKSINEVTKDYMYVILIENIERLGQKAWEVIELIQNLSMLENLFLWIPLSTELLNQLYYGSNNANIMEKFTNLPSINIGISIFAVIQNKLDEFILFKSNDNFKNKFLEKCDNMFDEIESHLNKKIEKNNNEFNIFNTRQFVALLNNQNESNFYNSIITESDYNKNEINYSVLNNFIYSCLKEYINIDSYMHLNSTLMFKETFNNAYKMYQELLFMIKDINEDILHKFFQWIEINTDDLNYMFNIQYKKNADYIIKKEILLEKLLSKSKDIINQVRLFKNAKPNQIRACLEYYLFAYYNTEKNIDMGIMDIMEFIMAHKQDEIYFILEFSGNLISELAKMNSSLFNECKDNIGKISKYFHASTLISKCHCKYEQKTEYLIYKNECYQSLIW